MYAGWDDDAQRARSHWGVESEFVDGLDNWLGVACRDLHKGDWTTRYVEAVAKTGSRYVVMVTRLRGGEAVKEGGDRLISVVWPWQDCKVYTGDWIEGSYVAEHLTAGRYPDRMNGGDFAALTMTIQYALGMEVAVV